ncbi:MAG TPA: ABC transporter substrate-binding protein [Methylomirabilota bacterium]|jgi:peptide/nickel transport system substrate-binding protein|nr:ABC transporter substrate-binding protein [Methylomirabilota bacterium]
MIDSLILVTPTVTIAAFRDRHTTALRPEREKPMSSHVRSRLSLALVVALAVLTAFTLGVLVGPPAAEAQKKKVLNIAAKEPDTLDPHMSILGQSQAIARFMHRGLTRFAIRDGKVTTAEVDPDLAESWTLSPEGTIWTFKLKKGVQFHKGFGELTAEDVKFSFERQISRAPGTRFGVNLEVIKSIEVVDPHTVQIALKSFDPIFLLRMVGYQQGYIVSKKAAEKYGEQFKWNPVGTGPFYFDRHSPREKVVLKAFDKYHLGRPSIDEVNYFDVPEDSTKLIGLEKGTFDLLYPEAVTADFADQVKKMGAVIDKRGPGTQERFYINMTAKPFDDIRVRKAFMHAIDRKAIKETMYPGGLARVAPSCVPPGYFGHIPMNFPEHNPALAKKLLAEAGHPNGFTIKNYFISKSFFYPKVLTLAQEQLKQVGIIVELQVVEHATFHENIRKNLNPFVLYGGTRLPDADPWLSLFFDSKEIPDPATGNKGTNFAHYRAIDDLLAAGRVERDVKKRAAIYAEAQKRIERDLVCLPISDLAGQWARNPKRVSTPFDPEYGEFSLHYSYNYPEMLKVLN